jgi:glycosyltransferase involved in cell wall biosynthesis
VIFAMKQISRLVVISHVPHYFKEGQFWAYGPYAREIDVWADLFPTLTIAAPLRPGAPGADCVPFTRDNIEIAPQVETGGTSLKAKLIQMVVLPRVCWVLAKTMKRADAIHVRCPGNLGLLGAIMAPAFSNRLVAKYSNQWSRFPGEALSWKIQRWLLQSRWWKGPVTVYARREDKHGKNVVPFFTSVLTNSQICRARHAAQQLIQSQELNVLYVGRLSPSKNVDKILGAIALLRGERIPINCTVIGEGPERRRLEKFASERGLEQVVKFTGGLAFEAVQDYLEKSNVLVLISETEGWPKAIAEAMAFGLVCIGSERGLVPELLGDGRGITVPPGDAVELAKALRRLALNPEERELIRTKAAQWAQQFSLEGLRQAICDLLNERWGANLVTPRSAKLHLA